MKKVFLSTAISDKIDDQGNIIPEFRDFIEKLLDGMRKADLDVNAAVEYDEWKLDRKAPPELGIQKDIFALDSADVVIALVNDRPSAGVQFEIGYAVAKGKHVILARPTDKQLAYFNQGVIGSGMVTLVSYDDTETLVSQLIVAINGPAQ